MGQTLAKSVSMTEIISLECNNTVSLYEGLMPSYVENCKNDADLQAFDDTLKAHTVAVVTKVKEDGCVSLDALGQVVEVVSCVGKKHADAVVAFKSRMNAMKDKSYKDVLSDYWDCSIESVTFLNDLERFLNTARRSHSCIEQKIKECIDLGITKNKGLKNMKLDDGIEEAQKMSNILKNLVNDHSAGELLEKSRCLLEKQKQMLNSVIEAQKKLGEEEERIKHWRKLTNYLFAGYHVMLLIGTILVACLFPFGHVVSSLFSAATATVTSVSVASDVVVTSSAMAMHWIEKLLKIIKDNKSTFNSIEETTDCSIREMKDLKYLIDSVSVQVDALLGIGVDFADGKNIHPTIEDIKHYLKNFLEKIKDLEKKIENCRSTIMESRKAVVK